MGLSKTAKIMILSVAGVCVVFLIAGLIVINLVDFVAKFEKALPFVIGIELGCIVSVLKIVMLEKSINFTLDMGEKSAAAGKTKVKAAGPFGMLFYMLRFMLTVAVLAFAFIRPDICGRFGVILGILSMQFSGYAANIILKKIKPDNFENLNDLSKYDDDDDENGDDNGDGENSRDFEKIL